MTLGVAFVQDEIAVSNAVHTHVHDGLIAHAHSHTAVAIRTPSASPLLSVFAWPAVVVIVLVGLTSSALWAVHKVVQAFFGAQ